MTRLGSSAAALTAGVVIASQLLDLHWKPARILDEAARIEGHPDNVAACVLGSICASAIDNCGAAHAIRRMGPKLLLIKRGEYGVLGFEEDSIFAMPAYPLEEVFDPTGAGDTFAGGCMGYLARLKTPSAGALRRAIAQGSVMASLVVERFGMRRLWEVSPADIEARYQAFVRLTDFQAV